MASSLVADGGEKTVGGCLRHVRRLPGAGVGVADRTDAGDDGDSGDHRSGHSH
jgi:hypothetical protein